MVETSISNIPFIIPKNKLTPLQIVAIYHHIDLGQSMARGLASKWDKFFNKDDEWLIWETETDICGSTSMNNFDMNWFLCSIGVNENDIQYESS